MLALIHACAWPFTHVTCNYISYKNHMIFYTLQHKITSHNYKIIIILSIILSEPPFLNSWIRPAPLMSQADQAVSHAIVSKTSCPLKGLRSLWRPLVISRLVITKRPHCFHDSLVQFLDEKVFFILLTDFHK